MKILFVLPRMSAGGLERVTLNLIEQFLKDGDECVIALRKAYGERLEYARALVEVNEFAPRGMHQFVPGLAKLIRRVEPTHVVTALADVAALTWAALRLAGSGARWIYGAHNSHAPVTARRGIWGKVRYLMDDRFARFVYRNADAIVAVSEGVRSEIVGLFRVAPDRVTTIYNPVVTAAALQVVVDPHYLVDAPFRIVALGRLERQKGFDVLIAAMKHVRGHWTLDIWGEGRERSRLESQITQSGLDSAIRLRGYTADPLSVLMGADLCVLSSRFEGLPTVLVEALACQCQIVASDCPHGPREILQNGKLGELVQPEDPKSLAGAIHKVMTGQVHVAPKLLLTRAGDFTWEAAYQRWRSVLEGAA